MNKLILNGDMLMESAMDKIMIGCLLLYAIMESSEGLGWNNRDRVVHLIERPDYDLLAGGAARETIETLTREVRSLALLDAGSPATGAFDVLVGDHRVHVRATVTCAGLVENVDVRLGDTTACRAEARAILGDYVKNTEHMDMVTDSGGRVIAYVPSTMRSAWQSPHTDGIRRIVLVAAVVVALLGAGIVLLLVLVSGLR